MATATLQELTAEVERLRQQNASLLAAKAAKLTIRGNPDTGTVSVFGINGRFPVSLYPDQWSAVFAAMDMIKTECKRDDIRHAAALSRDAKRAKVAASGNGASA